jgi:hypothetical protein
MLLDRSSLNALNNDWENYLKIVMGFPAGAAFDSSIIESIHGSYFGDQPMSPSSKWSRNTLRDLVCDR